jgi:hypothetical protein
MFFAERNANAVRSNVESGYSSWTASVAFLGSDDDVGAVPLGHLAADILNVQGCWGVVPVDRRNGGSEIGGALGR